MNREDNQNKGQNVGSLSTCIVFFVLIFGITITSFFVPIRSFSENENRYLEQKPEFSIETLVSGKYTSNYETYITDQFLMRDQWIGLKTMTERALMKKDINGVYFGKDGYLIEKHEASKVKEEQTKKNIDRLQFFVDKYTKELGKDCIHVMLVPTASEILSDKLPAFANGYDQNIVLDRVNEVLPEGTFVDVQDTLKEHKDEYIYYRTDHHWTANGAFYAYQDWAKQSGFEPFAKEAFDIEIGSDRFLGTIYSKVNVKAQPDTIYLYKKKGNPSYQVTYNMEKKSNSLYEMEKLNTKDKYSVYLGGNNALVEIQTENNNGRKLLVIKDSFSHSFVPLLVDHFETVAMVDFRYFNMGISSFIEQYGITDVLVLYNTMNFVQDKNTGNFIK